MREAPGAPAGTRGLEQSEQSEQSEQRAAEPAGPASWAFAAFEAGRDAMLVLDDERYVVYVNPATCLLAGVAAEALIGRRMDDFAPPQTRDTYDAVWTSFLLDGYHEGEYEMLFDGGSPIAVESTIVARIAPGRHLLILRDVSERRLAAAEREHLATVLDVSDDAITAIFQDGLFSIWNRGAENLYGYTAEEAIGQPLNLVVPPGGRVKADERWHQIMRGERLDAVESERVTKDGRTVVVATSLSPIFDPAGEIIGVAAIGRDITQAKEAEAAIAQAHASIVETSRLTAQFNNELERLARVDSLTGLKNRRGIEETLQATLSGARRRRQCFAVLLIDVDHFKHVNDTLGHQAGDAVLLATAQTMRSTLRAEDAIGRWGGEEFLVVLPDTDAQAAVMVAERIRTRLVSEPRITDQRAAVTVTIGAAVWTSGGMDELLSLADAALYAGKAAGRDTVRLGTADLQAVPVPA
jgi:diguanylate cyclase (GGDEF)-like protein/PAS domain S-box-containing protein